MKLVRLLWVAGLLAALAALTEVRSVATHRAAMRKATQRVLGVEEERLTAAKRVERVRKILSPSAGKL